MVIETDSSSEDDIEIDNATINSNKAKTVNLGNSWDFHNVQLYTWKSYCWKGQRWKSVKTKNVILVARDDNSFSKQNFIDLSEELITQNDVDLQMLKTSLNRVWNAWKSQ